MRKQLADAQAAQERAEEEVIFLFFFLTKNIFKSFLFERL